MSYKTSIVGLAVVECEPNLQPARTGGSERHPMANIQAGSHEICIGAPASMIEANTAISRSFQRSGGDIEQGLRRLFTLVQGLQRKSATARKIA